MDFTVTRQRELFKTFKKYEVKHPFLCKCLGDGNKNGGDIQGFRNYKGDGYIFLTYFVEQALGFRRYPFYSDRVVSSHKIIPAINQFNNLTTEDIDSIIEEVKNIYEHVQNALHITGLDKVKLIRRIKNERTDESLHAECGQATHLYQLKMAAELLNHNTVQVEVDILNSFGEGDYKGSEISLYAEINPTDIFYCHELVNLSAPNQHLETGEWVVLNRDPRGIINLPIKWIQEPKFSHPYEPFTSIEDAKKILENPSILRLPPVSSISNNKNLHTHLIRRKKQSIFGLFLKALKRMKFYFHSFVKS